jgi:hypothetical protein
MGRFLRCAYHSPRASRFSRNWPAVLWGVRSEVFAYRGEHYLGFGQPQASVKAIKLSMIRLGNEDVREDVVIGPGLR